MKTGRALLVALGALAIGFIAGGTLATAEADGRMVRLAKLTIDPAQLEAYKAALKEEIEDSIRLEPGVLTLYAVSENDRPTHFTILEIYASRSAYEQHIKSSHFLKYKTGTEKMVKSLELIETTPLLPRFSCAHR